MRPGSAPRGTRARPPSRASGMRPSGSDSQSSSNRSPVRDPPTPTGSVRCRAQRRPADAATYPGDQRRGVRRRRGVHLRHGVRRRAVLFEHMLWYRPRPLQMRLHEWISPSCISLRDLSVPHLQAGPDGSRGADGARLRVGFHAHGVVPNGGRRGGLRRDRGRPPGARVVDLMNYATDGDLYLGWAEAAVHGRLSQPLELRYNVGSVFKRAIGNGSHTHASRAWTSCWPSTATRSRYSTCCRSARRGATGAPP